MSITYPKPVKSKPYTPPPIGPTPQLRLQAAIQEMQTSLTGCLHSLGMLLVVGANGAVITSSPNPSNLTVWGILIFVGLAITLWAATGRKIHRNAQYSNGVEKDAPWLRSVQRASLWAMVLIIVVTIGIGISGDNSGIKEELRELLFWGGLVLAQAIGLVSSLFYLVTLLDFCHKQITAICPDEQMSGVEA